jgi:parallel beta-helix repeat protein
MTLRDYDHEKLHARVRNNFPILCVIDGQNVVLEDLTVDGNKAENTYLDGCRGGAIYLYHVKDITVRNCVAHDYNGDGISFQISSNVKVLNCESYGHAGFGVHPGTGSDRPTIQNCRMHNNGQVGLYLCWRVRHGRISHNSMESNGQYGISIGHKDTDNEFEDNTVAHNGVTGVLFRDESFANSGHRNTFRGNRILDNGDAKQGYGFLIYPHAGDIVIEGNQIAETRDKGKTQRFGVYKLAGAGNVTLKDNDTKGLEAAYREAASAPTR